MVTEIKLSLKPGYAKNPSKINSLQSLLTAIANVRSCKQFPVSLFIRDDDIVVVSGEENVVSFIESVIFNTVFKKSSIIFNNLGEKEEIKGVLLAIAQCYSNRKHPIGYGAKVFSDNQGGCVAKIVETSQVTQENIKEKIREVVVI